MSPHRGAMILALGIVGLILCPVTCPIAWYLGRRDLAEMRAGSMDREGEGLTNAGVILGIIGTIILGLGFLAVAGVLLIMFFLLVLSA